MVILGSKKIFFVGENAEKKDTWLIEYSELKIGRELGQGAYGIGKFASIFLKFLHLV